MRGHKTLGVELTAELDLALRAQARVEDRSLGYIIRRALTRDLSERGHRVTVGSLADQQRDKSPSRN